MVPVAPGDKDVTDVMRRELRLGKRTGVTIVEVDQGGVSHRAGLRAGDIILQLNYDLGRFIPAFVAAARDVVFCVFPPVGARISAFVRF